jgi:hypothetical protein
MVGEITIKDLIENNMISVGDELMMQYGPRGQKKKKYTCTIQDDGSLTVLGQTYNSPSYAAIACIQDAGSSRKTVNGWTAWMTKEGKTLDGLRMLSRQ